MSSKNYNLSSIVTVLLISAALIGSGFYWYKLRTSNNTKDDKQTLIVGTSADFPPLIFIGENSSEPVGFEADLMKAVCEKLGKKVEFVNMPFTSIVPQMERGMIPIAIGGITPTTERAKKVLFSDPYISDNPLLVISRADEPGITSIDALKAKEIIVNQGYTADLYFSNKPGFKLKRLQDLSQAFRALENKQGDVFVTAAQTIQPYFKKYSKAKFKFFEVPETNDTSAVAVSKTRPELLEQINNILIKLQNEGVVDQLKDKWGIK